MTMNNIITLQLADVAPGPAIVPRRLDGYQFAIHDERSVTSPPRLLQWSPHASALWNTAEHHADDSTELSPSSRSFIARSSLGENIRGFFHGAPLFDDFMTAMSTCVSGPPYVVSFPSKSILINGCRLGFNRQRGPKDQWVSCGARVDGRSYPLDGSISLWSKEKVVMAVYVDGLRLLSWIESFWALSPEDRNRLMHALNGNRRDPVADFFDDDFVMDDDSGEDSDEQSSIISIPTSN